MTVRRGALGFHSKHQLGEPAPDRLCGGSLHLGLGPLAEVGHNALHNRLRTAMTNSRRLTGQNRPAGSKDLLVAWETLTNSDNPN